MYFINLLYLHLLHHFIQNMMIMQDYSPQKADIVFGEGRLPINRWLTLDLLQ